MSRAGDDAVVPPACGREGRGAAPTAAPATMQGYRPLAGDEVILAERRHEHRHTRHRVETATSWSHIADVTVIGFGIAGGCAVKGGAAGARYRPERAAAVAAPLQACRGTSTWGRKLAAGDRSSRFTRGDVQVPGRGLREPDHTGIGAYYRRQRRHFNRLEGLLRPSVVTFPASAVIQPNTEA